MVNPVTVADLIARHALSAGQSAAAPYLLTDAWAIIRARIPGLEARLTAATLDVALVVQVETAMVLRVLSNPDGKRQEAIDDYSWTRDNAVSTGLMYLSDAELDLLSLPTLTGAFTITPYGVAPGLSYDPWDLIP